MGPWLHQNLRLDISPPSLLSSGSYLDSEGLRHQDDFDVSLLVCHCAAPFEEQGEAERHTFFGQQIPYLERGSCPSGPVCPAVTITLLPSPHLGYSSLWCSPANESCSQTHCGRNAGSGSRPDDA